jgi:hypothetical protein
MDKNNTSSQLIDLMDLVFDASMEGTVGIEEERAIARYVRSGGKKVPDLILEMIERFENVDTEFYTKTSRLKDELKSLLNNENNK